MQHQKAVLDFEEIIDRLQKPVFLPVSLGKGEVGEFLQRLDIGLGERRAQAVRRALMLQGAIDGQLSTVSYGEERPAAAGHDEEAWAKNRRVEIVYLAGGAQPQPANTPQR